MSMELANHEIVVIAAFLAGAETQRTDTEDIAVKANEIAPKRFTWRKYPSQINIEAVRKRLWDACKPEKGGYLVGSERKGWLLTEAGAAFARKCSRSLQIADKKRTSLDERRWLRTERVRLLASETYTKFKSGQLSAISAREAKGFFRIDEYVSEEGERNKVLRLLNAFGEDRDLGPAVKHLADIVGRNRWHPKRSSSRVT